MTQYSSRGSMPSVSVMPGVSSILDVPKPTPPPAAAVVTVTSSAQSPASDKTYTGQAAIARFSQLEFDYTTLNVKVNCNNGRVSFGASFYPADSKATEVEKRREEVADLMGVSSVETRLTKARLAKMIMPCMRAGNPQAYTKIQAQTYGPLADCVLESISANTLSSRLRVVTAEDGEIKLVMRNFMLADQSPIVGEGKCNFGIAVLHKLHEKYPQLYPQFSDYMDQEDLEAALESDDLEDIFDAEEAITQEFEKFIVNNSLPPPLPLSPNNQRQASRDGISEQATKAKASSLSSQALPLTITPAMIEGQPAEKKGKVPSREAQPAAATNPQPVVPPVPQSTGDQSEQAPICNLSASANKKRGANEAGFRDEKPPKRMKDDGEIAASNAVDVENPAPNAFDLLAANLGVTNEEPADPLKGEVVGNKKRSRDETGSDETQAPATSKRNKTHNDGATTKDLSEAALYDPPTATTGEMSTDSPTLKQATRPIKIGKSNKRPAPPAKPLAIISTSVSSSGTGSTASGPSTGRTTPQLSIGASPPPKLQSNNSRQHKVLARNRENGKPCPGETPKPSTKKTDKIGDDGLEPSDLLTVVEADETSRASLPKPTYQRSASRKETDKIKASEAVADDTESISTAKKPKSAPKQKILPGPSPYEKGDPRPADCPTEDEVGLAWWNKKEGLGGKHYKNITNKLMMVYLAYHGIEFTDQRGGGRDLLVAKIEEISPDIQRQKAEAEEKKNRRRPASPPQESSSEKNFGSIGFSKKAPGQYRSTSRPQVAIEPQRPLLAHHPHYLSYYHD